MKRIALLLFSLVCLALGTANAESQVRIAHMLPGGPSVDVLVNDVKAFGGTAYKGFTDFLPTPAGTIRVGLVTSGTASPVLTEASFEVRDALQYTVIVLGTPDAPKLMLYLDEIRQPAASNVRVRVIHASPDAPKVELFAISPASLAVSGALGFGQASRYVGFKAGTYSFEARIAGTKTVVLSLEGVQFELGRVYTIVVTGSVQENSLAVVLLLDSE
jgi:Domain of unknown function (DUF4397)